MFLTLVLGAARSRAGLNLAVPAGSPFHVSDHLVPLIGKYLCFALLAISVDLIWGFCGILSLGHGAFFALGGYAMGMYLMRQIGPRGVYAHPVLPDFMVFLNWKRAALVLARLRPFLVRGPDGARRCRACSPSCSAGSPSARA